MKKLILFLILLVGCQPSVPVVPIPQPVPPIFNPTPITPPNVITENDSGKTFLVSKGTVLTLTLRVNISEDYFWSFSNLSGDFETVSDLKRGTTQTLKLKVNDSGNFSLQYCQFTDSGLVVLSNLSFGVKVQ